jgi:HTH-type transcriptional regulator/antitoxin HipB
MMETIARSPKQIGVALQRTRKLKTMSQKELGEQSGLWQETISKIESGSEATKVGTLCTLLAALDLELVIRRRTKGSVDEIESLFS